MANNEIEITSFGIFKLPHLFTNLHKFKEIGLQRVVGYVRMYRIIDEKLFNYAVIKYELTYNRFY